MEGSHTIMEPGSVTDTLSGSLAAPALLPARWRKVAILGFGKTAKDSPWGDTSWDLWGMNGFWRAAEADFGIKADESRYTLWFDMHTIEYTRNYGKRAGIGDSQERWLEKQHPFPVLMIDEAPEFPAARRFPIEELVRRTGRDYFTSTVSYMLAFALTQDDVAEVGLWGIDLIHDTEYSDQRPCAEYWIGRLEAAGIKVTIHEDSALLRQRGRYGYEPENPLLSQLEDALATVAKALGQQVLKNRTEAERLMVQAHVDSGAQQFAGQFLGRLDTIRRGGKI